MSLASPQPHQSPSSTLYDQPQGGSSHTSDRLPRITVPRPAASSITYAVRSVLMTPKNSNVQVTALLSYGPGCDISQSRTHGIMVRFGFKHSLTSILAFSDHLHLARHVCRIPRSS